MRGRRTLGALAGAALLALAGCKAGMPLVADGKGPATLAASAPEAAASAPAASTEEDDRRTELTRLQSLELGLAVMPEAQAVLDRLMARVQAAGPQPARFAQVLIRPKLSYNAATTPSGFIVIDLGWLKSIDSEAELLALLAHEYGHIVREHLGSKNALGTATHWATVGAAVYAARTGSNNALGISLVNSSWTTLLMPSWSRGQEYEADQFALETTQAMGLPFVPSMRAFLDRIQSVEKSALKPAGAPPAKPASPGDKPLPQASDDHPPIEERIARVQQLMEGRPRLRPAPQARDEWRAVKATPAFQASEEEYLLAAAYFDAVRGKPAAEQQRIARLIDQRPKPLRTAAAMSALTLATPANDLNRRAPLLLEALKAPDATFLPYRLLAHLQRDQLGQFEPASDTLMAALERFQNPPQLLPEVIEFMRITDERINAIPQAQRPLPLGLFQLKNSARRIQLAARCAVNPEVAEACSWAGMNEAQRQAKLRADKDKETALTNKLDQKVQKLFK